MGTRFKDYPIYTYDEPAVYSEFSGGLNTDPSNDHLLDTELRDVTNMTFLSGALVKRKGAHKLCDISSPEKLSFIQGIFLFTYRITYIIIAADGKLFQGVYNEGTTIELNRLYIRKYYEAKDFQFDETDPFVGIEEKNTYETESITKHDGFTQTFFLNALTGDSFQRNYRGDYSDIKSGLIAKGDTFLDASGLIAKSFVCINEFDKAIQYPDDSVYWFSLKEDGTSLKLSHYEVEVVEGEDPVVLDSSTTQEQWESIAALNKGVYDWKTNINRQWVPNDVAYYNGYFYRCKVVHQNNYVSLYDERYFYDLNNTNRHDYSQETYLVFQNHSKIEAATFNNKLYIATGTRIIEVYLDTDELRARPLPPYICNYTEITKIGYNYLSPYPELAVTGNDDAAVTEMDAIKIRKTVGGRYLLTPIMHISPNDDISNYSFRWEKYVNGSWLTIIPYRSQVPEINSDLGATSYVSGVSQIEVNDANTVRYRCSVASSFKSTSESASEWKISNSYLKGDVVFVGSKLYRCLIPNTPNTIIYQSSDFSQVASIKKDDSSEWETKTVWEQVYDLEIIPFTYLLFNQETGKEEWIVTKIYDYVPDTITNIANRSATSVLFDDELGINDTFKLIHSCKSVLTDGSKLLFYNDAYNSGQWFKTVIDNPYYITQRGSLSFKTSKNEALIKVVPFQGNLIAFANSPDSGGSIHMVQGNGDDYDDGSGYYSPYRRSTINESISCDDAKTVQVCDNYLIFKHYRIVYCINASDLSNDVVRVTQCNERVLEKNGEVMIPWEEPCVSEVTDSYYALMWPKRYTSNVDGELILEHPGIRMKMYYKTQIQRKDGSYGFPWLKDEGDVFGLNEVIYVKGKPLHLKDNSLVSFFEDDYQDLGKPIDCLIRTKGMGLGYADQFKFIERILVSYHRDQYNPIDLSVKVRNEAGHTVIDSDSKRFGINDLGVLHVGNSNDGSSLRLTSTIRDDKVFNSINMFPCLLAEAKITAKTKGSFTLTAITYHYTSCDNPDTTPYDTYTGIVRPKEVK